MKISLTYDDIEKNALDFKDYAGELQEINNGMRSRRTMIKNNWVSTNTAGYFLLYDKLLSDMQVDINKMTRYSNIVLGVKDKFKDTDLKYAKEMSIDKKDIEVKL